MKLMINGLVLMALLSACATQNRPIEHEKYPELTRKMEWLERHHMNTY